MDLKIKSEGDVVIDDALIKTATPGSLLSKQKVTVDLETLGAEAMRVTIEDAIARRQRFFLEAIAKVCHEANRAICRAFGEVQPGWGEAPDWQRESAIKGVEFALANPDAPPSAQHDAWMADKIANGWVWGTVKHEGAKTHPCIVPYQKLPPHQRAKDHVFQAIVRALTGPR